MELAGTTAIVTGAARGIGRGIALCLAAEGVNVVVADLGDPVRADMDETAAAVRARGVRAATVDVDVRDIAAVRAMVQKTLEWFGRLDILVNNAGVVSVAGVAGMDEATWDRIIDTNLKGTFLCSQAVIPHMMERRSGRIVNISSQAGKRGYAGLAHYCASKFGIIGFTQALAFELASANITVNAVCPGEVNTAMWTEHLSRSLALMSGVTPEEAFERFIRERVPLGRPQTPEDIGQAVVFLCRADNITGESINVTGGSEVV